MRVARTFTYDSENRLLTGSAPTAVTLTYDPLGRLQTSAAGGATTTFLYPGASLAAEYNGSTVLRRYVPGPGVDEPLVWYEGSGTTSRRWLSTDDTGSVIGYSDSTGASDAIYGYGPNGEPGAWSGSRYSYTGQIMIPEAQLYYYKARAYDPILGRFLQTDPVGYAAGDMNLYGYVGNDPINAGDPTGELADSCDDDGSDCGGGGGSTSGSTPVLPPPVSEVVVNEVYPGTNGPITESGPITFGTIYTGGPNIGGSFQAAPYVKLPSLQQNTQKPPCQPAGPNFQCDANGNQVFTPAYQKQVCENYAALQEGSAKTNDGFAVTGVGSMFLKGPPGLIVGGLSAFSTFISSVTTGGGFRPFGVVIIPKSAPPPGC
jgi:RHS repeat-associated protein